MPKTEIDYSNTIIYKITCNDPTVTDVYVGHTTNFVQRKHAHKQSCQNAKAANHTCKVYEVMRANGGWTNWKMEIINFFECKDHYEARKKEQEYFVLLKATLNSIEPMPKPKVKVVKEAKEKVGKPILYCTICKIHFNTSKLMEHHNTTNKHKKMFELSDHAEEGNNLSEIVQAKFICTICKISCSRQSEWDRHIVTHKHLKNSNENTSDFGINKNKFICKCGKIYINNSGLWKHTKKCKYDSNNVIIENTGKDKQVELLKNEKYELQPIIIELQKQIIDLQKQLLEIINK